MRGSQGACVGIGGVRVDRAVAEQLMAAIAPHALEAAMGVQEFSCASAV